MDASAGSGRAKRFGDLAAARGWYDSWLRSTAWPLWWTAGADHARGGFHEALGLDGQPPELPRRARVQARQAYAYALAGGLGWDGPWREAAWHAMDYLMARFARPDGGLGSLVDPQGAMVDDAAVLYDHAFALLACATLAKADPGRADELSATCTRLRTSIARFRNPAGAYREAGDHPYQANANMHLLEAALAWEAAGAEGWTAIADEIVGIALSKFIDPEQGFLREFFDAAWRPAAGDDGRLVEPGHQFEWAWLLARWGRARGNAEAVAAARRLYAHGRAGVDVRRGVAVNALWDDLSQRDASARLWPQTEHLKAALILGDAAAALSAAEGLAHYLQTPMPGLWRDRMLADGGFVEEPAPASSFYHIVCALEVLLTAPVGDSGS